MQAAASNDVMHRHRLIWMLVLIVGLWLTGAPLMACPYMAQGRSCCPVSSHTAPQCPLSKSMQNCPVFAAAAKLGPAQAKPPVVAPDVSAEPVVFPVSKDRTASPLSQYSWLPSGPDLLHRVRVLRI